MKFKQKSNTISTLSRELLFNQRQAKFFFLLHFRFYNELDVCVNAQFIMDQFARGIPALKEMTGDS